MNIGSFGMFCGGGPYQSGSDESALGVVRSGLVHDAWWRLHLVPYSVPLLWSVLGVTKAKLQRRSLEIRPKQTLTRGE
jgi:hypothetical protein